MKILVTGAAGFIGSAFVRDAARRQSRSKMEGGTAALGDFDLVVANVRSTRGSNVQRLQDSAVQWAVKAGLVQFTHVDITSDDVSGLCEGVDAVVNYAARTFVDHAIRDPEPFTRINVVGTQRLLEEARRCKVKKFVQASTDEVYGQILEGAYREDAPLNPRNPYAASKAAADALAISYAHSYGLNTLVVRNENVYGPWQHPQKAIPTFTRAYLAGDKLPVYGDGQHVRQWLHLDDHVAAMNLLLRADTKPGDVYHLAGCQEVTNTELAKLVIEAVDRNLNRTPTSVELGDLAAYYAERIRFIDDQNIRPGHDRRYALDSSKLRDLGWRAEVPLRDGIAKTVEWYVENRGPWLGVST